MIQVECYMGLFDKAYFYLLSKQYSIVWNSDKMLKSLFEFSSSYWLAPEFKWIQCAKWLYIPNVNFFIFPNAKYCSVPSLCHCWTWTLTLLVFSLLLTFSWSIDRWLLWKWRQMCVFHVLVISSALICYSASARSTLKWALHASNPNREIPDRAYCRFRNDSGLALLHLANTLLNFTLWIK